MARTEMDLLNLGLPKWPQHYVTGKPVTVAQAKEIIRRTDSFFASGYGGNNHEYNRWVRATLGMPPDSFDDDYPRDAAPEVTKAYWEKRREAQDAFDRRWKPLATSYVHNSWVSCSFIGGPHGWCHPDGKIGFVDNVGKWPSVEEVYKDWQKLAEAFPFLDVAVTLYDGESSEHGTSPVVSMVVRDSKVTLVDPFVEKVHALHEKAQRRADSYGDSVAEFMTNFNNSRREQGLPDAWIEEWAAAHGPLKEKP